VSTLRYTRTLAVDEMVVVLVTFRVLRDMLSLSAAEPVMYSICMYLYAHDAYLSLVIISDIRFAHVSE
jgi:hypothetical protein